MPTDLRARVSIDDKVVEAISNLKKDKGHNGTVKFLKERGHDVTPSSLSNIEHRTQDTIPHGLYLELIGKEGAEEIPWEKIHFKESSDLARRIAYWHCFFFDVKKSEFAEQVAREAEMHGLEYSLDSMGEMLFFKTNIKRVEPTITDIVAKMFNTANGSSYSLYQIEDMVKYFDTIHNGERDPNTVSWSVVEPVVDTALRVTGKSFNALMNGVSRVSYRRVGRTNGRKVTVKQYSALLREIRESPHYRLIEALSCAQNTLKDTGSNSIQVEYVPIISGLTKEELQLVREGNKIYGEAFMQHIFPAYVAIKQEHGFPAEYFEWVVRFPSGEKIGRYYKPSEVISKVPISVVADFVGSRLIYYKGILDINASRRHNMSVTADGLVERLKEAGTEIMKYASQHLLDLKRV